MNENFVDDYEHDVENTPCEVAISERKLVPFHDRIVEFFPDDSELAKLSVVSYLGVPLFDTVGGIMGHLAVMPTMPLPPEPRQISPFHRRQVAKRNVPWPSGRSARPKLDCAPP